MLITLAALMASAAMGAAEPASAADANRSSTPAVAPQVKLKRNDSERMVCRSIAVTGSRFAKSTCRTRAEWDRMTTDARDDTLARQQRMIVQRPGT